MRKVCGNIFEGRNVQQKLNVKHISSRNLQLYDIYTGIYAESFKSIGMLAYRASFCYAVNLKFVQMLS